MQELELLAGVSADAYFAMTGKNPCDYVPKGVNTLHSIDTGLNSSLDDFLRRVPDEAEVVVGFTVASCQFGIYGGSTINVFYGTALIPKNPVKENP